MDEFINNPKIARDNSKMSSSALLKCIQEALDANKPVAAKQICEDHLQAMPNDPDAYRYLSQIHAILGEFDQACRVANRALEITPQDPRAWSDLGRVHVLSGNLPAGITCFEESVKCDSGYADGWHNLGLAFKQSGQQQRAFDALKKALLLNPERADTYLCLGIF